ncbi:exonuclease SbcCD subunit D [Hoyosella rhizosphaerae]|nr:exonuclease SbcCD subunit D [Hoyosella rhizosphaerae]MBN4925649.1 exonuclease SbcCD subunit D [Hoyosella rhizosphaerae]
MRILHTSDWHIGRTFHGVDLLDDQRAVLARIAEIVAENSVDVVVMSGDLYDRAMPSADAIRVCADAFVQIRDAGAQIIATSGNHDSATRVGSGAAFTAAGGLHLKTRVSEIDTPVVLNDEYGPVAFYAIPYLEPDVVRGELGCVDERSHHAVVDAAMGRIRANIEQRRNNSQGRAIRTFVSAHAFVVGAHPSESERTISVGGVETVPQSVFDGVDYVALGHLHTPQKLSETVRYSGSPLPYSFGERSHHKAVWLIDFGETGVTDIRAVNLPVVRPLSEVRGELADLLADPNLTDIVGHYISAVLTDPVRPTDAMRALRQRFPHTVRLTWERPHEGEKVGYRERMRGVTDREAARRFLIDTWKEPEDADLSLIEEAFASVAAATDD